MSVKFSARDGAVRFALKLTPRGGRDAIDGWAEDAGGKPHLKARVSVPPEDGKANMALIALLAKKLDVAKSCVRIAAGETSRLKTIEIDGDSAAIGAKLSEF
ncbi:MAG TPA: DUF167 family protein [Rhizomicrobium sp.]|nr:DUF167 family protein [Rhizomicrobium sp.]